MQEYECKECKSKFQKTESCGCCASESKCPKCGSTNIQKVEAQDKRIADFFSHRKFG